jgi:tetratricopeptide (TPR) repeat protein
VFICVHLWLFFCMRSTSGLVACLLLITGCGTSVDVMRPRRPRGQPGSEAQADDQAEPRLEQLPASTAVRPPVTDLDRAADLSRQAAERRAAGDLDAALKLQTEALDIRERLLGPNNAAIAATLTAVAGIYAAQGNYAAAEPPLTRALAIREALGADSEATAESLNNLALLYAAEGKAAEAEPLYQRAIAIFETTNDHAALATTLENYAALLEDTDRAADAAAVEKRARAVRATDVRKGEPVSR